MNDYDLPLADFSWVSPFSFYVDFEVDWFNWNYPGIQDHLKRQFFQAMEYRNIARPPGVPVIIDADAENPFYPGSVLCRVRLLNARAWLIAVPWRQK